jgi:hypothetical protein
MAAFRSKTTSDRPEVKQRPDPFGIEPFTSDSAVVALNAHKEANVHSQGFHSGF